MTKTQARTIKELDDIMYDQAKCLVQTKKAVTISDIQSNLRIGCNRATRLLEAMDSYGIIEGPDANGKFKIINKT